jgi:hypothetical protein
VRVKGAVAGLDKPKGCTTTANLTAVESGAEKTLPFTCLYNAKQLPSSFDFKAKTKAAGAPRVPKCLPASRL